VQTFLDSKHLSDEKQLEPQAGQDFIRRTFSARCVRLWLRRLSD